MKIRVSSKTIDRIHKVRTFSTIDGARKFLQQLLGENAEVIGNRAISFDGVVVTTCDGARMSDLVQAVGTPVFSCRRCFDTGVLYAYTDMNDEYPMYSGFCSCGLGREHEASALAGVSWLSRTLLSDEEIPF